MAARDAGRLGQATSSVSADGRAGTTSPSRWYRRVTFWRAVAGMALAIALACAVVAGEFSSALISRTRHYRDRLHQLTSNITAMRGRVARDDREIAGMRNTVEIEDDLRRILAAPDARLIRLAPPGRAAQTAGVITFSPALHTAAIQLAGLPAPAAGTFLNLWWTRGKHAPLMAARLRPTAGGEAALTIVLPAADQVIEGAIVTVDSSAASTQPDGEMILKGTVARAPAPSGKTKHKGG
jgi:hypothetical protein